MSDALIKTLRMSFNRQNNYENCYLYLTAFKETQNFGIFVKLAACVPDWHPMPIVEPRVTVILLPSFFFYL